MGQIVGLFGTRGALKIRSETRPRENLFEYPWFIEQRDGWHAYQLGDHRPHQNLFVVELAGVSDRETAASLMKCDIGVKRADLPAPLPGEIYWADLIGVRVLNEQDVDLGVIAQVSNNGAHDVLRLKAGDGRERLIPFVRDHFVLDIDLAKQRLRVDWHPDD